MSYELNPSAYNPWFAPPTPPGWSPIPTNLAGQAYRPLGSPVALAEPTISTWPTSIGGELAGAGGGTLVQQAAKPTYAGFGRAALQFVRPGTGVGLAELGAATPPSVPALGGFMVAPYVEQGLSAAPGTRGHPLLKDVGGWATRGLGVGTAVGLAGGPFAEISVPVGAGVGTAVGAGIGLVKGLLGGGGGEKAGASTGKNALKDQLTTLGASPDEIARTIDISTRLEKAGGKDVRDQYLQQALQTFTNRMISQGDQEDVARQDMLTAQAMSRVLNPWMQRSHSNIALAQQAAMKSGQPELAQQYMALSDEVADAYAVQALMFGPQQRLAAAQSAASSGTQSLFGSLAGQNVLTNQATGG